MKVTIHMAYSDTIRGALIRFFTWSKWNHVAIQINETVFDSTVERGVGMQSLKQFENEWKEIEPFSINIPNPQLAKKFLHEQIGKSYDITAIVGFIFKRNWSQDCCWFCSELVAKSLREGGIDIKREEHRISPRDIIFILNSFEKADFDVSDYEPKRTSTDY